ncbi:MAG TPA: bifunctional phosphoribosylaminoimidazolecarboxamide formyltransferase/IMP cyclohydrolase [Candidatus Acidoferrales bacterium]|nr:bifunctional phosphoribosylaminoimidazolecarboxamide formyltransferase/IMP cyclohydrolase [Candidatus Acidoferrales bacterium]
MAVERALVSVYDKTGVVEFARRLAAAKIEIVSTGGTARLLREAGLAVREVAELTGWPEMLAGRVKTLHPKIHGGILFRRDRAEDQAEAEEHKIAAIDLVVVNLYPFEVVAAKRGTTAEELIENIDIGGPAMVRSAAKNLQFVGVVTDPGDYGRVAEEIERSDELSLATRLELARKAYAATARYDGIISTELERLAADGKLTLGEKPPLPERLHLALERREALRYGENPHQRAALYVPAGREAAGLAGARQLQGKELSYNNLVDLEAAWELAGEFARPAAAIIKHTNPAGVAENDRQAEAYRLALACDPVSAFGGVLAFNRRLEADTAAEVAKLFVECIVAPGYEPGAREALGGKKNLRLVELKAPVAASLQWKGISGGWLVQEPDVAPPEGQSWSVVSERAPTEEEREALRFAWIVVKHVKSNAIVFARVGQAAAVGAGQMSRVDSVKIAAMKAQVPLAGTVVASDAFFPFPDGVEESARAGATAVIQPGGSVRDAEVIAAANRLGLAMVFTGRRHFRH